MSITRKQALCIALAFWPFLLPVTSSLAGEYQQVAGLIDLRTTFSDGGQEPETLVRLARERGFRVVFINDHDRVAMEYGVLPWRHLLKIKKELNSINLTGKDGYLEAIRAVGRQYPDMVVIPGVETAPFYYWTGNPWQGLTAHNWERHLLVMGLEPEEELAKLPILHNDFSLTFAAKRLPLALLFLATALLGLFVLRWAGPFRTHGIVLLVLGVAFAVDCVVFSSSPYDQYHGDQGVGPYQAVIDHVKARGGMTFWNHPETRSGKGDKPPIRVDTPPYPDMLLATSNYTGFAALYGDRITMTEPGKEWDHVLNDYCQGKRPNPAWGISAADYHEEGSAGEALGNFPTVFLVRELSKDAILSALRNGKMYAVHGHYDKRWVLAEFSVTDTASGRQGISGDEIILEGAPVIKVAVQTIDETARKVQVRIIRGGKLIKTLGGETPFSSSFEDTSMATGGKTYYRMDVNGEAGSLTANPIFVTFRQDSTHNPI